MPESRSSDPSTVAARASQTTCINCGTALQGAYCHACGQKAAAQRFSLGYLLHEIPHAVFHLDRGFFATLKQVFTRVGALVNDYLDGKRARYFNPLTLLVILAGVSGVLFSAYPFQHELAAPARMGLEDAAKYREFLRLNFKYYSASLMAYLPLTALLTWAAFWGARRNYGEHLIINAFVHVGSSAIMVAFFPLLVALNGTRWFIPAWSTLTLLAIGYLGVAYFAVFRPVLARWSAVVRALVAVLAYLVIVSLIPALLFPLVKRFL